MTQSILIAFLMAVIWTAPLFLKRYSPICLIFDSISVLIQFFCFSITSEECKLYWAGRSGDSFSKFNENLLFFILLAIGAKVISIVIQYSSKSSVKFKLGLQSITFFGTLMIQILAMDAMFDLYKLHQQVGGR